MPRHRDQPHGRSGFDLSAAKRICDRCNLSFDEGFTWPGLGIPVTLCKDCTEDIEESVKSYGESGEKSRVRLLDRLRGIGM